MLAEEKCVAVMLRVLSQSYPRSDRSYSIELRHQRHCQGLAASKLVELSWCFLRATFIPKQHDVNFGQIFADFVKGKCFVYQIDFAWPTRLKAAENLAQKFVIFCLVLRFLLEDAYHQETNLIVFVVIVLVI